MFDADHGRYTLLHTLRTDGADVLTPEQDVLLIVEIVHPQQTCGPTACARESSKAADSTYRS